MHIVWLESLDSDVVKRFRNHLANLSRATDGYGRASRLRRISQTLYLPVLDAGLEFGEYIVPETPEYAAACKRLDINPLEISANLQQLYIKWRSIVNVAFVAAHYGISIHQVRSLARLGVLPGKKTSGQWQFAVGDLPPRRSR